MAKDGCSGGGPNPAPQRWQNCASEALLKPQTLQKMAAVRMSNNTIARRFTHEKRFQEIVGAGLADALATSPEDPLYND